MNASALRRFAEEDNEIVSVELPLSGFNREHRAEPRNPRSRAIGIALAAAVHVLLVGGFLVAGPSIVEQLPQELTMVSLSPQSEAKVDLPPPPKFEQVVQPQVAMPDVVIETPAPAPIAVAPQKPVVAQSTPVSAADNKSYFSKLLAKLYSYKRYPEAARLKREKGIAVIRITMLRDGTVSGVTLVKSSGSDSLDQEALSLPMRAQPLPAMPDSLPQDRLTMNVNVDFMRAN